MIYPLIYADSKTADNRRFWVINSVNELICANLRYILICVCLRDKKYYNTFKTVY